MKCPRDSQALVFVDDGRHMRDRCPKCEGVLLDRDERYVVPVSEYGDTPEQWEALRVIKVPRPMVDGLLERVKNEQAVQSILAEPQALVPPGLAERYGITLALFIGLFQGEEVIGLLVASFRGRREPFDARQMLIAQGMHLTDLGPLILGQVEPAKQAEITHRAARAATAEPAVPPRTTRAARAARPRLPLLRRRRALSLGLHEGRARHRHEGRGPHDS